MPRYSARKDGPHNAIAAMWRRCGWRVIDASAFGQHHAGFPDLICCRNWLVVFVEVKSEGGELRPAQSEFNAGRNMIVLEERTEDEAQEDAETWRYVADCVNIPVRAAGLCIEQGR